MKLLKVGDRYINLDLVTDIQVNGPNVVVFLAVTPTSNPALTAGSVPGNNNIMQGVRAITFQGDDAKTLQKWLVKSDNAEDPNRKLPQGMGVIQGSAKRQD